MVRKTSKLSFGLGNKDRPSTEDKENKEKEKGKEGEKENEKELPSRPSATLTTSPSSGSSSFFNVSNAHNLLSQQETNGATAGTSAEAQSPPKAKILPPIPRDFAATTPRATSPAPATPLPTGEVDKDVFETMGASTLSARFEINIVKVSYWHVCTKLDT